MALDKIIYAVHPVAPEVKKEVNAQGFKLLDARFAPEGERIMDGQTGEEYKPAAAPLDLTREGIADMDKADLLDLLESHGWDGDKRLGVDKLREALIGIVFVGA